MCSSSVTSSGRCVGTVVCPTKWWTICWLGLETAACTGGLVRHHHLPAPCTSTSGRGWESLQTCHHRLKHNKVFCQTTTLSAPYLQFYNYRYIVQWSEGFSKPATDRRLVTVVAGYSSRSLQFLHRAKVSVSSWVVGMRMSEIIGKHLNIWKGPCLYQLSGVERFYVAAVSLHSRGNWSDWQTCLCNTQTFARPWLHTTQAGGAERSSSQLPRF